MTIWLLAIILLCILAAVGFQQGAIRMSISFLGILFGVLLAGLVGKLVKPVFAIFGMQNPILLWVLPVIIGFVIISIIFKVIGQIVHAKVDVYYKYKAGDLRLALWERLNARLGVCVGLLNGVAYMVLISFLIYAISYCTLQMSSSDNDPRTMRIVNQLGRDLQSTGMSRVARAVDSLEKSFYDTADLAGVLYQTPLLEARLLRYPGFLSLGERPEFQALSSDEAFAQMRLKQTPVNEVLNHPSAKAVFQNPELLKTIWATLQPNLADLGNFLTNGVSEKFNDRLLGRWRFDAAGTLAAYRRAKPNTPSSEVPKIRAFLSERFGKSALVAAPDHMVILKNMPQGQPGTPNATTKTLQGKWAEAGTTSYDFDLEGGTDKRTARYEGSRLLVTGDGVSVAFTKED